MNQREIKAKIASLVRKRSAINQEIHYWRGRLNVLDAFKLTPYASVAFALRRWY